MPTDKDIQRVKDNLANMQAFNDYLYNNGNSYITEAYLLLSETQTDRGKEVCFAMMQSAFYECSAAAFGPVGGFAATTFCGIIDAWGGTPPPDMNSTFADLVSRFQAASRDMDGRLAVYHDDPATYWDTVFSYGGQTCTLGDLATVDFPKESDELFTDMMTPCERGLDQYIWKDILTNGDFQLNEWLPGTCMNPDFDFNAWGNSFYKANPSYWAVCFYHQDTGDCGDASYWDLTQWNLATGAGMFSDGAISDDAANYLFSDLSPGTPNLKTSHNGLGLYTRDEVFTSWGIKVHQVYSQYASTPSNPWLKGPGGAIQLTGWFRYVRAKAEGKAVLSDLQADIGMAGIKERILAAVKADPTLRAGLQNRPRETMEQILGVVVPDFMTFDFVLEGPRRYGLVIPWGD